MQLQRLDQCGPPSTGASSGAPPREPRRAAGRGPAGRPGGGPARGGVDAPILEHAEDTSHEARPGGAGEHPLALVVTLEGAELGEPGVVQHGGTQRAVESHHRGDPHDRVVDHRAAPRPHLVLVVSDLDRQRLARHAVGEQPEDALHVRERHGRITHGNSTSTISATARCASASSLSEGRWRRRRPGRRNAAADELGGIHQEARADALGEAVPRRLRVFSPMVASCGRGRAPCRLRGR